jgi:DNA polymerase (family X)
VDIRVDGSLALSDKLLDLLDYAIVSLHSSFEMTSEATTRRIIKGLSHPKALILGHPTGQLINHRDPVSANWEEVFSFCAKNKKVVEVNASPDRLDLPDDLIRKAIGLGVKLIINTDSHAAYQMQFMKYGIWQARRGFAAKKDIANSFSFEDLRSVLKLK